MAYPDLPPNPTFWRCPNCANEILFFANGIRAIVCAECGHVATEDELIAEHARTHPAAAAATH